MGYGSHTFIVEAVFNTEAAAFERSTWNLS
jgi:hypothetical protein